MHVVLSWTGLTPLLPPVKSTRPFSKSSLLSSAHQEIIVLHFSLSSTD